MTLTIFTPTYNRCYLLQKLYNSLKQQTSYDFEWIVVDDGSSDDTHKLMNSFIEERNISIQYFRQLNGGKHRAINKGVQLAKGELFFVVDSDDWLKPNAVEEVLRYYLPIKDNIAFAGICGLRYYPSGERVGGKFPFTILDCTPLDFRYKYKIKGDMAEVFKTEILRKYPFPEIEGEKFCPEALVCNRIGEKYKLRYFNSGIYICDYLPDGLTAKIVKVRMESPKASMLCYSELYKRKIPFFQKLKAAINFWRFSFCSNESFSYKINQIGYIALCMYPLGFLFHLKDSIK